jgi:hypothetical protein
MFNPGYSESTHYSQAVSVSIHEEYIWNKKLHITSQVNGSSHCTLSVLLPPLLQTQRFGVVTQHFHQELLKKFKCQSTCSYFGLVYTVLQLRSNSKLSHFNVYSKQLQIFFKKQKGLECCIMHTLFFLTRRTTYLFYYELYMVWLHEYTVHLYVHMTICLSVCPFT